MAHKAEFNNGKLTTQVSSPIDLTPYVQLNGLHPVKRYVKLGSDGEMYESDDQLTWTKVNA